jgi:uncharacterized protein YkwD
MKINKLILALLVAILTSSPAYASIINVNDLLNDSNAVRAANGVAPLQIDNRLNNSASLKAQDMFANNYWANVSPNGTQPWYWFTQAGYPYHSAGENLARGFSTSQEVINGWMNSPTHRANLLSPNFYDVGFAVVNGTLQGRQTILVVAHYGQYPGETLTPVNTPVIVPGIPNVGKE